MPSGRAHFLAPSCLVLVLIAAAGCGGGDRDARSPRAFRVDAGEVILLFEPAQARAARPPPQPMFLGAAVDPPAHPYEFHDDPLSAGGSMEPGFTNRKPSCAPWSPCEVQAVLQLHKELFRACLPSAAATAVRVRARAQIDPHGTVRNAEVEGLDAPGAEAEECVADALARVPFPIESDGATTALTVSIQLAFALRAAPR